MCGIIACRGTAGAVDYLISGLKRLEYRGYDSAGLSVVLTDGTTATFRTTNRVGDLRNLTNAWTGQPLGGTGIGHTRWATHGGVSTTNAHPHHDCTGRISVVHNGIIENSKGLRAELENSGHNFTSDVDSETICHLIEDALNDSGDLREATSRAVARLTGSWALVVMDADSDRMVAARHRSPLLVGQSQHGSFLASDIAALDEWVDRFQILEDRDVVEIANELVWTRDGRTVSAPDHVATPPRSVGRSLDQGGHMLYEINEQPEAAARVLDEIGRHIANGSLWANLGLPPFNRLRIVACGTSLNAGRVIGGALSRLGRVPFDHVIASEASETIMTPHTLTIAISQSGETADVLNAIDDQPADAPVLALVNNVNSTLARQVDAVLSCAAGPEIGVAATKTFVCQILAGTGLVISSLSSMGIISRDRASDLVDDLYGLPGRLAAAATASIEAVPSVIEDVKDASGFLFLGRGAGVPYAEEGALKLKELTYRWAEAYPAGELKHGPLALVEEGTPVIVVDNGDPRIAGSVAEVLARGGLTISVGQNGSRVQSPLSPLAPCGPLEAVVPLQLLAFALAEHLGHDVDKPRNLAKSVTVD